MYSMRYMLYICSICYMLAYFFKLLWKVKKIKIYGFITAWAWLLLSFFECISTTCICKMFCQSSPTAHGTGEGRTVDHSKLTDLSLFPYWEYDLTLRDSLELIYPDYRDHHSKDWVASKKKLNAKRNFPNQVSFCSFVSRSTCCCPYITSLTCVQSEATTWSWLIRSIGDA